MSSTGASSLKFSVINLCPQNHWHVRTSCVFKTAFFQRHVNDCFDFYLCKHRAISITDFFLFFLAQVSGGQRMERALTRAVTLSWRLLNALAPLHSTHLVILWTPWSSTKANMSATHPTSWGQPSLTRPHSTLMVRTRWQLINPKATTGQLLKQGHSILKVEYLNSVMLGKYLVICNHLDHTI